MKIVLRRFLVSAQLGALVALAPMPSFAEDASIGAKIFDVAVLRTLGSVRLAVGIVMMIPTAVLYTFRLPFGNDPAIYREAAEILIVEPGNYVLRRPLGEDFSGD